MNKGEAELYVVARDGARYSTLFNLDGLATAAANEQERWWEHAIRSAWEKIEPQPHYRHPFGSPTHSQT